MSQAARRVTVLYFAAVRERLGRDREELELPAEIADVGAFSEWLESTHPPLKGTLAQCRLAVGEEFRKSTHALETGDVIAVIPPVAGG
jgi:molybdopterin converting factor subunit 1